MVAVLLITSLVALLFVRASEREFVRGSEERALAEAEHITYIFFHTVWSPVHTSMPNLGFDEAIHPRMMTVFTQQSTFGLGVVGLNVWSVDGALVWSSDAAANLATQGKLDWFDSVVANTSPMSEFESGRTLTDLDGVERELDVVRTFYPVQERGPAIDAASGSALGTLGALEITQDVTSGLATARATAVRMALVGWAIVAAVAVTLLFALGLRADGAARRARTSLVERQQELEEAQAQHARATKLAAMGELVASVAHELNNPLTGIAGLSQLLLRRDLEPKARFEAEMIHEEANRSARIVQNLLSYARARQSEKAFVSINAAVEGALELRRYHLMVNNVTVSLELMSSLPRTMADPHKLQQVVLNLISNAEQAMLEANDGGHLILRTRTAKGHIRLSIIDDGPGIPAYLIEKVFDPFFTTKSEGQGTGLGLSICYSIVQEHGGTMRILSEEGKGTEFLIDLPILGSSKTTDMPRTFPLPTSAESHEQQLDRPVPVRTGR